MAYRRKNPPGEINAAFSRLVRERRKALGMSQLELATRTGVNPAVISGVETAGGSTTLKNALPMARVLGINIMEDLPDTGEIGVDYGTVTGRLSVPPPEMQNFPARRPEKKDLP